MDRDEALSRMIARFGVVFGTPDHSLDADLYVDEIKNLLAPFGPTVLQMAADRIIRNGGREWPTPKECVNACVDAAEELAEREAARDPNAPRKKMPWEEHQEQAQQWAIQYVKSTDLGQEAMAGGWADRLRGYARSYGRQCLGAGRKLPAPKDWQPPKDVVADFRKL